MNILNRGYWVTTLLSVVGMLIVSFLMLDTGGQMGSLAFPSWTSRRAPAWVLFFLCGVVGLATSIAFVYITQYYTAGSLSPGQGHRRGLQDRPGHQHHRRHGGRLRDHLRDRHRHRHRAPAELLAG